MRLYGRDWTRRELEARVGRVEQIGGVRRALLTEGREAGTEVIRVRTGAGLAYEVTPSKGLDISLAEFGGAPISWQSPNGDVSPAHYSAEGAAWLRTASGGLLMTCGLINVGSPSRYSGVDYGLHGRAHQTPAAMVGATAEWTAEGDYEMTVRGVVEETSIFGERLRLSRIIRSRLGDNRIVIEDRVENCGFAPCPHMMLYHFNFGFPLLTERTELRFPDADVHPRESDTPLAGYDAWQAPDAAASERVYYHELRREAEPEATAEAVIRQPAFPGAAGGPLTVRLRWRTRELHRLVQWRMPGAGEHVLGLEPANCRVEGVERERERGTLRLLQPGERVDYRLELAIDSEA